MINPHRNTPPEILQIENVGFVKPEFHLVGGMIPSWFMKGGSKPIVRVEWLFKSGSKDQEKSLQAFAATHLLKSGTRNKSAYEISQSIDFYGASVFMEPQKDIISIGFFSLEKHLEKLLDIFMEFITGAVFPENELDLMLKNKKQKHIVNQKKIQHRARVRFNELIYGASHPYGKVLKLEDFDKLNREDLLSFHQRFIHPGNCIMLVSGNYNDNIVSTLNQVFGKYPWEPRQQDPFVMPSVETVQERIHQLSVENSLQSAIRIGKLMPGRTHPGFHKISISNALLGGFFGSRLMRNIRQEKGYTYGINSAVVSLLHGAYFFITTQVGKDFTEPTIKEIYRELQFLQDHPASMDELQNLKNYLSAGFLRSFDGPFMQMERFREILLFGLDYDHYEAFLPALNQISASDIQQTASEFFNGKDMLEVVAG